MLSVGYQCIAFMPNKGEVMDVVVKSINKMGFFAEAGPLQVFVSNHLIPEDFEFDTSQDPAYVTVDGEQKIVAGCEVRLRIVGTRIDATEIVGVLMHFNYYYMMLTISIRLQFAVGSIKDNYLGVISSPV